MPWYFSREDEEADFPFFDLDLADDGILLLLYLLYGRSLAGLHGRAVIILLGGHAIHGRHGGLTDRPTTDMKKGRLVVLWSSEGQDRRTVGEHYNNPHTNSAVGLV